MAGSIINSQNFGLFQADRKTVSPASARGPELRHQTQPPSDLDIYLSKKMERISEREGEDAILTGGTRSLHRRLLALNIYEAKPVSQARPTAGSSPKTLSA